MTPRIHESTERMRPSPHSSGGHIRAEAHQQPRAGDQAWRMHSAVGAWLLTNAAWLVREGLYERLSAKETSRVPAHLRPETADEGNQSSAAFDDSGTSVAQCWDSCVHATCTSRP